MIDDANRLSRPLHIGITCHSVVGGSGVLAVALGHELAARGHEVHFIGYDLPLRLDPTAPRVFFHQVPVSTYSVFNFPEYTMPLAVTIADVITRNRLDIVHSHYAVPHCAAALLAKGLAPASHTKFVCTLHGTDVYHLAKNPSYAPLIRHALNAHDAVTAVSDHLRNEAAAALQLDLEIDRIYNFFRPRALRASREEVRAELGLGTGELLFVHASNLRPIKRIPDLLNFVAKVPREVPFKLLVLAGEPFAPFEPLVRELGIEDRLIVKEAPRRLDEYLAAGDLAVYTSDEESFCLAILESMAYGVPTVAFKSHGVPEVVEHGVTGALFALGDVDGMVRGSCELLRNVEKRAQLGEAASRRAATLFAPEVIVPQYLEIYRRALSCSPRAVA